MMRAGFRLTISTVLQHRRSRVEQEARAKVKPPNDSCGHCGLNEREWGEELGDIDKKQEDPKQSCAYHEAVSRLRPIGSSLAKADSCWAGFQSERSSK